MMVGFKQPNKHLPVYGGIHDNPDAAHFLGTYHTDASKIALASESLCWPWQATGGTLHIHAGNNRRPTLDAFNFAKIAFSHKLNVNSG